VPPAWRRGLGGGSGSGAVGPEECLGCLGKLGVVCEIPLAELCRQLFGVALHGLPCKGDLFGGEVALAGLLGEGFRPGLVAAHPATPLHAGGSAGVSLRHGLQALDHEAIVLEDLGLDGLFGPEGVVILVAALGGGGGGAGGGAGWGGGIVHCISPCGIGGRRRAARGSVQGGPPDLRDRRSRLAAGACCVVPPINRYAPIVAIFGSSLKYT